MKRIRDRRKPEQPDMCRECFVNWDGKAQYFPTYTEAAAFVESNDGTNLHPFKITDFITMRDVTFILTANKTKA